MGFKFLFTICLLLLPFVMADLRIGFYQSTCPQAESIVRQAVQKHLASDKSITAALLRMHFHDCFVRGCDASILIDSTSNQQAEKDSGPNQTVRGYELIDEIKKALEAACPSTVSCADIITIATRDAVALSGGPSYLVPTGRRDGLVSDINDVNLPGPTISVSGALQTFNAKGFNLNEMVTLLGAHTVGVAHCSFFSDRVSNFQGTGKPDPTMDASLASRLSSQCNSGSDPTVFLDQNTSFAVDNEYYKQLILKRGIMQIDQELAIDRSSVGIVASLANNNGGFLQSFAKAMVKMGSVDVLVDNAGEIRTNCRAFNPKNSPSPPRKTPPVPTPSPPKKSPVPSPNPPKKTPIPSPNPPPKKSPVPSPNPPKKTPTPPKKSPVPSPNPPKKAPSPSPPKRTPVPSPNPPKRAPVPSPKAPKRTPVPSPKPKKRPAKKSTTNKKSKTHKKKSQNKDKKPKGPPSSHRKTH